MPIGPAATRASSSSARGAPTRPRWSSSSSSERPRRPPGVDLVTKLTLEYDGGGFAGWARQPGLRSVQDEVQRALAALLGERVALTVAGRTDRGAHAWGQVASYPHEAVDPMRLNALLPNDVAVLDAQPCRGPFDARGDAVSRTYCYRVLHRRARSAFERGHALWWGRALDERALDVCARALVGRHDFTAFTPTETDHVHFERHVLSARWRRTGDVLEFWIEADSFLRHMNRVLVGTMLEVGDGQRGAEDFARLPDGCPRADAGPTVPAHGLYLAAVAYPAVSPGRVG